MSVYIENMSPRNCLTNECLLNRQIFFKTFDMIVILNYRPCIDKPDREMR